jgi:hypothetical protein
MARWIEVPQPTARAHPLYGPKGWLVLLAIGLGLSPFGALIEMLKDPLTQDDIDRFPWLPSLVSIELGAVIAAGLFSWVLCWALLTCKRWFPTGYLVFVAVILAFPFVDAAATIAAFAAHGFTLGLADVLDPHDTAAPAPSLLWCIYVVKSRRVNVTYRNRLPAD